MWFKQCSWRFKKSRRTCPNDNVRKHFFRDPSLILLIPAGQFEYSVNIRRRHKSSARQRNPRCSTFESTVFRDDATLAASGDQQVFFVIQILQPFKAFLLHSHCQSPNRILKLFILKCIVEQKISLLPSFTFITSTSTNTKAPFTIMNVSMVENKGWGAPLAPLNIKHGSRF